MNTHEALQSIYQTLPSVKRDDIAKTHAEGEAILQTLWRTLHKAIQNNRDLTTHRIQPETHAADSRPTPPEK